MNKKNTLITFLLTIALLTAGAIAQKASGKNKDKNIYESGEDLCEGINPSKVPMQDLGNPKVALEYVCHEFQMIKGFAESKKKYFRKSCKTRKARIKKSNKEIGASLKYLSKAKQEEFSSFKGLSKKITAQMKLSGCSKSQMGKVAKVADKGIQKAHDYAKGKSAKLKKSSVETSDTKVVDTNDNSKTDKKKKEMDDDGTKTYQ